MELRLFRIAQNRPCRIAKIRVASAAKIVNDRVTHSAVIAIERNADEAFECEPHPCVPEVVQGIRAVLSAEAQCS